MFRCGNPDYGDALHGVAKPNLTYWVELYPETTLLQAADVDQILQKAADQEQEEIRKSSILLAFSVFINFLNQIKPGQIFLTCCF